MAEDKPNTLNEIAADFAAYQNPDLLKDNFSAIIAGVKFKKERMEEYLLLLADVRYAWEKTLRYRIYFAEFYSDSKNIEKVEALNHHIHAYLEDMTILKNKIIVFLNTLKNDIKKTVQSKDEKRQIEAFFGAGAKKTNEVFNNISKHRDPHHHRGMRFFDGDLLKAENAQSMMETFQNSLFDQMLNQERKPELMKKLEVDRETSFEIAKARWIQTAENNAEQASGYVDELFRTIRPPMYDFLGIKPVKELLGINSAAHQSDRSF